MKNIPFETGKYYHIYNRGNNRENIFLEKENYTYFLNLVTKYLLPISEIYSYCLLPNHFHLILKLKEKDLLPNEIDESKLFQSFSNLFNAYTKAINKKHGRRGSLFQEHLKRIEITKTDYLLKLIIYVNTNSSKHEIMDYKEYTYSSYKALLSSEKTSINRGDVLDLFNGRENLEFMLNKKQESFDVIKELTFEG